MKKLLDSDSLVSVLVPCYNAGKYVQDCLRSVTRQTHRLLEIIVIDDGSTDDSAALAAQIHDERITLISQSNRGAAAARNRALQHARGKWTTFLDADDELEPEFIAEQLCAITSSEADVCFGRFLMTWPGGRTLQREPSGILGSIDHALSRVLTDGWFPPNAILWRTSFIRSIGGWDESLSRNDDGELVARAILRGAVVAVTTGSRAVYRQHDSPHRISGRTDSIAIESRFRIATFVSDELKQRTDGRRAKAALCHHLLELAYDAFYCGESVTGRKCLRLAEEFGQSRIPGSAAHRFGCAVMGMEKKAALSRWLHSF